MKQKGVRYNWNCIAISIAALAVTTLAVVYLPGLREIDMHLMQSVQALLAPFPLSFAHFITDFGAGHWWRWPQIAAGSVLISHRLYKECFLLILFMRVSIIITNVTKEWICRERPHGFSHLGYSYPSGHALITMCLYGIIIYLIYRHVKPGFWRNFLCAFFGLFILLVCVSRMWIGMHFPADVFAGLLLGFLLVNFFIITLKLLEK